MADPMAPKKIVVTDDDGTLRDILQELFRERGHTVYAAANGEEALPLLLREKPDLLLLDLNMPLKDGLEVMTELRSQPSLDRMKILILSGSQNRGERLLCEALGAHGFVPKPFNCEDLVRKAEQLLAQETARG